MAEPIHEKLVDFYVDYFYKLRMGDSLDAQNILDFRESMVDKVFCNDEGIDYFFKKFNTDDVHVMFFEKPWKFTNITDNNKRRLYMLSDWLHMVKSSPNSSYFMLPNKSNQLISIDNPEDGLEIVELYHGLMETDNDLFVGLKCTVAFLLMYFGQINKSMNLYKHIDISRKKFDEYDTDYIQIEFSREILFPSETPMFPELPHSIFTCQHPESTNVRQMIHGFIRKQMTLIFKERGYNMVNGRLDDKELIELMSEYIASNVSNGEDWHIITTVPEHILFLLYLDISHLTVIEYVIDYINNSYQSLPVIDKSEITSMKKKSYVGSVPPFIEWEVTELSTADKDRINKLLKIYIGNL